MKHVSHREIFALAFPIMLSNVSTPLLGIVDTAVVGRLPGPHHVGAVALGSLVFSFVYWAFGFLRMGTTGLTAQALGAGDGDEVRDALARALLLAMAIGSVLFFCGTPIRAASLAALDGSVRVEGLASEYIEVRIRSAPATLANYAFLGWFVGLGKTRVALGLQLILNLTNMALDALFVLGLGWGVSGVAHGTVIAEWLTAFVGLLIAYRHLRALHAGSHSGMPATRNDTKPVDPPAAQPAFVDWKRVLDRERVRRTLSVNFDIMVRSMALVGVFLFFMARGASMGDRLLAANAILMHFIDTSAYFLDGMAHAAEALVGRAVGARDRAAFRSVVLRTTLWATAGAALISLVFLFFGESLVAAITIDPSTRLATRPYLFWAALAPLAGVWCFQLDGVFIGATRGPAMRNSMLLSAAVFFGSWWLLLPYENHGLWGAFYVFYLARALTLGAHYPALEASVGSSTTSAPPA